ncbi:MAG: ABC transporter permease [Wenzhouxiangellaceae bacterium]|nr:ABC transporter permease [Wenzhouxiangellaceae bacterium]
MKTMLAALRDELLRIFRDKAVLVITIGGSLFYALFYPLPYLPQTADELPIAVVDHDRTPLSRKLTRHIAATQAVTVVMAGSDVFEVKQNVRDGKLAGYVEIPRRLNAQVLRGEPVRVEVFGNAAYLVLFSEVAEAVSEAVLTLNAEIVGQRMLAIGHSPELAETLPAPIGLDQHDLFNPDGGYANYIVPAVMVLILQQTFLIGICMMQVGRAPLPAGRAGLVLLSGRAAAYLLLQVILLLVYLLMVYRVFHFPHQGTMGVAVLTLMPAFLAMIFLGFTLGPFFRTRETALQVMMLVSIPALFLAGFAWPAEVIPWPLDILGWVIPSTAAIDAFLGVHHLGATLADIREVWLALWSLAGVYLLTALLVGRGGSAVIDPLREAELAE